VTKRQFDAAVALATSEVDLSHADDTALHGCGLPGFKPATCTLAAAARFIRWHCVNLNGSVDGEALNEMRELSRKRWLVCDTV
jgi:hypothetical protein